MTDAELIELGRDVQRRLLPGMMVRGVEGEPRPVGAFEICAFLRVRSEANRQALTRCDATGDCGVQENRSALLVETSREDGTVVNRRMRGVCRCQEGRECKAVVLPTIAAKWAILNRRKREHEQTEESGGGGTGNINGTYRDGGP